MSPLTTLLAPITQRLPIVAPRRTSVCAPMAVQSPIRTGARSCSATPPLRAQRTVSCV